jgi:hypothetical protein
VLRAAKATGVKLKEAGAQVALISRYTAVARRAYCRNQDFCTPSAMSQKGGELTFPGLLTALTLTAMGRLPKVLLTIKSA